MSDSLNWKGGRSIIPLDWLAGSVVVTGNLNLGKEAFVGILSVLRTLEAVKLPLGPTFSIEEERK